MENNQYCRLCLHTSVVYYPLLKNNGKEMLRLLTGIEIQENSTHSKDACVKCWLNLKLAYGVQQHFIDSNKKLQIAIMNGTEIVLQAKPAKIEPNLTNNSIKTHEGFVEDVELLLKEEQQDIDKEEEAEEEEEEDIDGEEEQEGDDEVENEPNQSDDDKDYPEVIYIEADSENIDAAATGICPICGRNCTEGPSLYEHINVHYNESVVCEHCSGSYPNIAAYRDHIDLKHPDDKNRKPTLCGICQLSFSYKPLYEIHIATVHSSTAKMNKKRKIDPKVKYDERGNNLQCEECNKVLRNRSAYRSHVKGHIKSPCPQCGVEITIYNLKKHIALHKSGPAVCHLCGITSKNHESLRGHIYYTHSKKRLTCEECGRIFKKLYSYKMHIKKEHTGERSFTCDTCGKRFFTNYEMNTHIKTTHLKERNHICKFCKRGFSSRFSMKTHERQHTNEAPYICELCGQGFRQNVSLRAHRKSRHNIIENKKTECPICNRMFISPWALKSHIRSVHD